MLTAEQLERMQKREKKEKKRKRLVTIILVTGFIIASYIAIRFCDEKTVKTIVWLPIDLAILYFAGRFIWKKIVAVAKFFAE